MAQLGLSSLQSGVGAQPGAQRSLLDLSDFALWKVPAGLQRANGEGAGAARVFAVRRFPAETCGLDSRGIGGRGLGYRPTGRTDAAKASAISLYDFDDDRYRAGFGAKTVWSRKRFLLPH